MLCLQQPRQRHTAVGFQRPDDICRFGQVTALGQVLCPQRPQRAGLRILLAFKQAYRVAKGAARARNAHRARGITRQDPQAHCNFRRQRQLFSQLRGLAQAGVAFQVVYRFRAGAKELGQHKGRLVDASLPFKALEQLAVRLAQVLLQRGIQADHGGGAARGANVQAGAGPQRAHRLADGV